MNSKTKILLDLYDVTTLFLFYGAMIVELLYDGLSYYFYFDIANCVTPYGTALNLFQAVFICCCYRDYNTATR